MVGGVAGWGQVDGSLKRVMEAKREMVRRVERRE